VLHGYPTFQLVFHLFLIRLMLKNFFLNPSNFIILCLLEDKYFRTEKFRNHSWSNHGKQFYLVECLTVVWGFVIIIPFTCSLCWLIDADPVQLCMHQLGSSFNLIVPHFVQLMVLLLYLWIVVGCTYIVLYSISRLLIYACICGFWTSLSSSGGDNYYI